MFYVNHKFSYMYISMTTIAVLPDQRCFLQPGCADIDNFQFVTGFRFFCLGFPIYPEKQARIC